MFGFLKKKLGEAVNKLSKDVEEEVEPVEEKKEEVKEEQVDEELKEDIEDVSEKKGIFGKIKDAFTGEKISEEEKEKLEKKREEEEIKLGKLEEEKIKKMEDLHRIQQKEKEIVEEKKKLEEEGKVKAQEAIKKLEEEKKIKEEKEKKEVKSVIDSDAEKARKDRLERLRKEQEKEYEERRKKRATDEVTKEATDEVESQKKAEEERLKELEEEKKKEIEEIEKLHEEEKEVVEKIKEEEKGKGFLGRLFSKKEVEIEVEHVEEKKGIISKITEVVTKKAISEKKFEELFWELEVALLENNVAVEVIELIKDNLRKELVDKKVLRGSIPDVIKDTLAKSVEQAFDVETFDLLERIKSKKPYVIAFVGINGSGKTTTIAKMIKLLQNNNMTCVVAASDTFRAAAIQQLEEHTTKLGVKLIKHDYGSDPAAVAFDAVKYGQAKKLDCVLIDTAGRLHSNINLMDEMKKIVKVSQPDIKIFIGESITGNDCVEQAKKFDEAVGVDGIVLSKADIDEKGGAALSVSFVTKKPILYLGVGQEYGDLIKFDKEKIIENIGL